MVIQDKPKYEFPRSNMWSLGEGQYKVLFQRFLTKNSKSSVYRTNSQ